MYYSKRKSVYGSAVPNCYHFVLPAYVNLCAQRGRWCSQIHGSMSSVTCTGAEGALEHISHSRDPESKAVALLPPQGLWTQGQEWTRGENLSGEETQSVGAL